ncbi:MAG: amino acid adenylation domain-containing protein [Microcoleaceae cyanobacterium]
MKILETSQIQQANWFLYQLNPTGLADKVSIAMRIKSALDIQLINNTLQALIKRHPMLRTIYYAENQKLIQEVKQTVDIDFEQIEVDNKTELNQYLVEWIKRPFDLANGLVFRACLFSVSTTEHILGLSLHQIAADRESLLILINEFITIYESKVSGVSENLPLLNKSYTDYIQQEIEFINSSDSKKIGDYWQQLLGDDLPVLELPSRCSRPAIRTYNGAAIKCILNPQQSQSIRQLAKQQKVTLKQLLLAAFKVLIYRYTGEEDLLIGLWQNRDSQPEFKGVIGNFANLTVIRDSISGKIQFTDFLTQVSQTVNEVNNYKNYPFSRVIQKLKLNNLTHPPICQVAFSYQQREQLFQAKELQLEHDYIPQQKVDFDISLDIQDIANELWLNFKYNSDILDTETVTKMAEHFQNLLTAIVKNPQTSVGKLSLLNESEQQQILIDWNNTQTDYDLSRCLHQLFEQQVDQTPTEVSVIFEGKKLTYQELNKKANKLAHYLIKLGVKPETLVGICVERSLEMVIGLLAIQKAGGAYVPIDPTYPNDRIAYLLENSQVPILLTQNHIKKSLPEYQGNLVFLDNDWQTIAAESNENPVIEINSDNLIYIIYTSGSTGKPKGTMNTHKGVVNRILWMQDEYQLTSTDKVLQKTPFSFDVSGWEFWWPLITGARLIVAKPEGHKDPNYLVKLINDKQITTLHFVPSMLQIFLENPEVKSCQSLRQVFCSGEALSIALQERFFTLLNAELHNLYGPTEAAIDVTFWHCQPGIQHSTVPIGRPVANTQMYILNSDLQPVPIGVAGELYIGGVQLARGYLYRPELTAERFINNPFVNDFNSKFLYKTGDLARYLPDGNIEYLGRLDNQVKIRGNRIELGEIESVLNSHNAIDESIVLAKEYTPGDKRLVAYLLTQEKQPSITEIREFLNTQLPDYMIPSAYVFLSELPLTPNGKVNRKALPEPDFSTVNTSNNFVEPRDTIEQQLAEIWSSILQVNPVGIKDNFFELGGHSLLAISLMSKIQQQFNQQLPLSTLFTNRTIEDLANLIKQENQVNSSSLVPIQTQGNKSPFFCVHPAGGHVLCYLDLSNHIGNNQPFYGLQAQGFNPGEQVFTNVEEMARFYVNTIQEFQPQGPYQIGGWSFGGVVAFEIAQQLLEKGQEVSLLALLDPWVPILLDANKQIDNLYLSGALSRYFGGIFGTDNLVTDEELKALPPEEKIEFIIDKAEKLGLFPPEDSREKNRRFVDVLVGTLKATYGYKRRYYPGKVTVFRPQERHLHASDPQLVWVELYAVLDAADIELVNISGSHYSMMKSPHLEILAKSLNNHL